jgi:hypothetical protein
LLSKPPVLPPKIGVVPVSLSAIKLLVVGF